MPLFQKPINKEQPKLLNAKMSNPRLFLLMLIFLSSVSCARLAILSAPKKTMSAERSQSAISADDFFWQHFHAGDYEKSDEILKILKAAFLENPNDGLLASHIGFTHAWRISERSRLKNIPPNIVDEAILAEWYFDEALRLLPKDARIKGFLADMKMAVGTIFKDERKIREGYFLGQEAIKDWPEFNHFTIGYALSTKPASDEKFQEGLEGQWKTLDLCQEETFDRKNPDYSKVMLKEESSKLIRKKSVCWNSKIAPHNFEGFFMNMGDMLLKSGRKKDALVIYENAKLSKTFDQWPHKEVLLGRIAKAQQAEEGTPDRYAPKPMMIDSQISCMACHQAH